MTENMNPSSPQTPDSPETTGAAASAAGTRPRRARALMMGSAAAAVLILGGGTAYALGGPGMDGDDLGGVTAESGSDDQDRDADDRDDANDADDRDDADNTDDRNDTDDQDADDADDRDADDADDRDDADSRLADLPASDAASMRTAADQAIAGTGAEGVTTIEVVSGGYEIEVRLSDGTESDVHIAADGTVTVRAEDDTEADDDAEPLLDLAQLPAIETAALDAASAEGVADGVVTEISSSDDPGTAIEAEVLAGDGTGADVELDAALTVLSTDIDED
ncbi:hypothetical protein BF93_00610 [Brachybacterium phenoliresistens]|uniref:PepSY domain-containing protein n=1 Tax=Brachybacterium phenoliresistens TaxID=396014 RepID=Z9JT83_9MICO|nr:hypothetical protein [Brachybacterium phenoliresistens]EWS81001.1 hypothetical protein BF93_00610 [Brachybacterium phenoliresistens]